MVARHRDNVEDANMVKALALLGAWRVVRRICIIVMRVYENSRTREVPYDRLAQ